MAACQAFPKAFVDALFSESQVGVLTQLVQHLDGDFGTMAERLKAIEVQQTEAATTTMPKAESDNRFTLAEDEIIAIKDELIKIQSAVGLGSFLGQCQGPANQKVVELQESVDKFEKNIGETREELQKGIGYKVDAGFKADGKFKVDLKMLRPDRFCISRKKC